MMRVHIWVSGTVQGVGYRFSTQAMANQMGVAGWVRNLPDGRVEAVLEGTPEQVEGMLRWCQQGPRQATVQSVQVEPETPEGLQGFHIRR